MSRYIFKPLVTYFPGKTPEETEANKWDFIQAYKDSLTSGELLVDLYNYEIYVANNGLEYPVPSTPELRSEIIKWIESDEGPLASFSKNDLLNTKSDDASEANIARKKEKIKSMLIEVEKYNKACKEKIDEDENTLLRTEREIDNWYESLSRYTRKNVFSSNASGAEICKSTYWVMAKYIDLYKRLRNIINFINVIDETPIDTSKYNDELKEIFHELVNNQVAIDDKLDKSMLYDNGKIKVPNYEFSLSFNAPKTTETNVVQSKLDDIRKIADDLGDNAKFETKVTNNNDILTIKVKKKEGT
ncbi:MAG TPA: hypothetical protein PK507_03970 [bacterium]|nr:hypothetical protein [bacterium]